MVNIAIVGLGKSTLRYHIPYIKVRENINVKTIFNRSPKPELEKQLRNLGFNETKITYNLDDILNDNELDFVTIVTPAASHFELAKKLLENGKNVLCEKPFVSSVKEASILFRIAKDNNVQIMPFQNRRFDSDFLTLKHIVKTGYLGDLVELQMTLGNYRPKKQTLNPNNSISRENYIEGYYFGHCIHLLDRVISLFGKPEKEVHDVRSIQDENNIDDYFELQLFYKNNFKIVLKSSSLEYTKLPTINLLGTKGSFIKQTNDNQENDLKAGIYPWNDNFGIDYPEEFGCLKYTNQNGDRIDRRYPTINGDYGKIYDSFIETVLDNKPKLVTEEQVIDTLNILETPFIGNLQG